MNKVLQKQNKGFTLLLAIMVSGIVVAIGMSLMSITLKQFKISSILHDSETAFQAANAGVECLRYWDKSSVQGDKFDVGAPSDSISCFGSNENVGGASNGAEQNFLFDWTSLDLCTDASIYKFYDAVSTTTMTISGGNVVGDCRPGVECTVIESRGYNRGCGDRNSARTVERELVFRY